MAFEAKKVIFFILFILHIIQTIHTTNKHLVRIYLNNVNTMTNVIV